MIVSETVDDDNESDMPDERDLQDQFQALLEQLELPEKLCKALLMQPAEKKWKLICSHLQSTTPMPSDKQYHSPWHIVAWLDSEVNAEGMGEIQVTIASNPTKWLSSFFDHGGLHAFSGVLGTCNILLHAITKPFEQVS